ncbi:MAG: hypothetical protein M3145_11960 [Pseudomonadota bacterium]|nr:hypothetical protein [Pseudomonadota bacterium]
MGSSSHEERLPAVKEALAVTIAEMIDSPSLLLESLHYARESDLMAIMRAVAALDAASRLKILAHAQSLAGEPCGAMWRKDRTST